MLWVEVDSPEALEANLAGLAGVLGLPEASAEEQSVQSDAVLGWLHGHERWLLIADNADTELAAKAVRDRFSPNLRGAILVTSRLSRWPVTMPNLPLDLLLPEYAAGGRRLPSKNRVAKEGHNADNETAARSLAHELGHLPLALEQVAAFIIEMRESFERYGEYLREAQPELLSYMVEGGTHYPASVAKTWSITLEQLSPLSRALLRFGAWFAPEAIPRGIFSAHKAILSEALDPKVHVSELAVDLALTELARFSLIRITPESLSVHRLLQAVEQDALSPDERGRWLLRAVELFNAFAPPKPDDVRTWGVWLTLSPHAETLIEHTERCHVDALPTALLANQLGLFLYARAAYAQAEPLYQRALAIREKALGPERLDVAWILNGLAELYYHPGATAAEPLYQRALGIWKKGGCRPHADVAEPLKTTRPCYERCTHTLKGYFYTNLGGTLDMQKTPTLERALGTPRSSF